MARVLIVDDDEDIRELLSLALRIAGHDVLTASDGPAALDVLDAEPVDLMVLDVSMPQMSGLEVARRVRASPRSPEPLILMLSAMADPGDIAAGLASGADSYATKPFSIPVLTQAVDELLQGRSA
ncbi:response regulator transcription factor [Nocardioides sp. cx-173]|uniref:response regulator transcription factor n=1 Tax=Nocardioides sp. cx-173 TaxID=2898796 RepID=UPI001E4F3A90|nr:response regulator [Nocardioides sp. cx-173]MCD4525173.1 response regulator [Nocardioides sp. cx-173]UGB40130.1 response regulator [Nocardioides sp. cx-173]